MNLTKPGRRCYPPSPRVYRYPAGSWSFDHGAPEVALSVLPPSDGSGDGLANHGVGFLDVVQTDEVARLVTAGNGAVAVGGVQDLGDGDGGLFAAVVILEHSVLLPEGSTLNTRYTLWVSVKGEARIAPGTPKDRSPWAP